MKLPEFARRGQANEPLDFTRSIEEFAYKYKKLLIPLILILLAFLPMMGLSQYVMKIIILIFVYTSLALALNLVTGVCGQTSMGHAGFVAIGAYTSAILSTTFGLNFILTSLCGAVLAGAFGILLGIPTLRLSGPYLTIVTLGFGEVVRLVALNWIKLTQGPLGIKNIPKPTLFGFSFSLANNGFYYYIVITTLLIGLLCFNIMNSRTGRAFVALKENHTAAVLLGIETTNCKILAFTISAVITGFVGAFYAHLMSVIAPEMFSTDMSMLILCIVILGSLGKLRGLFVGAALLVAFPEVFRFLAEYRFIVYGSVLVIMMRFKPQGLLGWQSRMPYRFPKGTKELLLKNQQSDK